MNKYAQDVIDRARVWRSIKRMEKDYGRAPRGVERNALLRLTAAIDALEESRNTAANRAAGQRLVKAIDEHMAKVIAAVSLTRQPKPTKRLHRQPTQD